MNDERPLQTSPDHSSNVKKLGYSVKEAVYASGLGRNSILKAVHSNQLKHLRFNRRIIIPVQALEQFLNGEK